MGCSPRIRNIQRSNSNSNNISGGNSGKIRSPASPQLPRQYLILRVVPDPPYHHRNSSKCLRSGVRGGASNRHISNVNVTPAPRPRPLAPALAPAPAWPLPPKLIKLAVVQGTSMDNSSEVITAESGLGSDTMARGGTRVSVSVSASVSALLLRRWLQGTCRLILMWGGLARSGPSPRTRMMD